MKKRSLIFLLVLSLLANSSLAYVTKFDGQVESGESITIDEEFTFLVMVVPEFATLVIIVMAISFTGIITALRIKNKISFPLKAWIKFSEPERLLWYVNGILSKLEKRYTFLNFGLLNGTFGFHLSNSLPYSRPMMAYLGIYQESWIITIVH